MSISNFQFQNLCKFVRAWCRRSRSRGNVPIYTAIPAAATADQLIGFAAVIGLQLRKATQGRCCCVVDVVAGAGIDVGVVGVAAAFAALRCSSSLRSARTAVFRFPSVEGDLWIPTAVVGLTAIDVVVVLVVVVAASWSFLRR